MNVTRQSLEGREHFVVPTVMITVGTWSGSQGPIHYPADALRKSVTLWNGKPVVVYHPAMYHSVGYAGNPSVFNRQKVGTLFNARFDGHLLLADAWIDVDRVRQVDDRVADAIIGQRVMEVSTGLEIDAEASPDFANAGTLVAMRLYPDHLAILPDQTGACSIAHGCGLLRNARTREAGPLLVPALAL